MKKILGIDKKMGEGERIKGNMEEIWYLILIMKMFLLKKDEEKGEKLRKEIR